MNGFAFVHRERVRFRDVDAMGHVNNAVFLTYVEEARFAFLAHTGAARTLEETAMVVARAELDLRSPARMGEEIEIGVRTARLGAKSFDLEYELRVEGRLVAEARTVQVAYDYERREPMELPPAWRERLAA